MLDWLQGSLPIQGFSSVFEIGFGLNALLYLFEVQPLFSAKLRDAIVEYDASVQEARKKGVDISDETIPSPAHFAQSLHSLGEMCFPVFAVFCSLILLGLLVWSGFDNKAALPRWAIIGILIFTVGYLPLLLWWELGSIRSSVRDIQSSTERIRRKI